MSQSLLLYVLSAWFFADASIDLGLAFSGDRSADLRVGSALLACMEIAAAFACIHYAP